MAQLANAVSQVVIASGGIIHNIEHMRDGVAVRGSKIYVLSTWIAGFNTREWRCYSSSDGGSTWAEEDSANRPQYTREIPQVSGNAVDPTVHSVDAIRYGDNLWACCFSHSTKEDVTLRVFRFDMATDSWSEPPAGPTAKVISETFGDTSLFALWNTHRHLLVARRGDDLVLMRNFLFDDGGTYRIRPTVSVFSTTSETWTTSLAAAASPDDTLAFSSHLTVDARTNGDIFAGVVENDATRTAQGGPVGVLKFGVLSSANALSANSTILPFTFRQNDSSRLQTAIYQPFPQTSIIKASALASPYDVTLTFSQGGVSGSNSGYLTAWGAEFRSSDAVNGPWSYHPVTAENSNQRFLMRPQNDNFSIFWAERPDGISPGAALDRPILLIDNEGGVFKDVSAWRYNGPFNGRATNGYDQVVLGPAVSGGYALVEIADRSTDELVYELLPVTEGGANRAYLV